MQTPIQITFRDVPQSDALETRIREKAEKLEAFYPGIVSCRVVVESRDRHKHQGKEFCVITSYSIHYTKLYENARFECVGLRNVAESDLEGGLHGSYNFV